MRLNISKNSSCDSMFPIEIPDEANLETLLDECRKQVSIYKDVKDNSSLSVLFNGSLLHLERDSQKSLQEIGITNEDIIIISILPKEIIDPSLVASSSSGPSNNQGVSNLIANLVKGIKMPSMNNTNKLVDSAAQQFCEMMYNKYSKMEVDDNDKFAKELKALATEANLEGFVKRYSQAIQAANDPTNPEGQRFIADRIRYENIEMSMNYAMEHMPETLIPVHLLYINVKVNGTIMLAFVDTGAQVSVISDKAAERCGLKNLVDSRFDAEIIGVAGSRKMLGKIHTCKLEIEGCFFQCSFTVLTDRSIDVLIGLDVLRRHLCVVDLKNNVLRLGDVTVTRFLSEGEVPKRIKLDER